MSDNNQDEIQENVSRKARRKLILCIAIFVLLIMLAGAYGTFAYLQKMWPFESESGLAATQVAGKAAEKYDAAEADATDEYVRFDSAFTFNLMGRNNRNHMVQVEVVLLVHGSKNAELAEQHLPLIGATISEICSQQQYESLASPTGRQRFKRLLLDGIRTKLTGVTNEPIVEQVLFINFVMQ